MIGAGTLLYQVTHNSDYLYEARQTAKAALAYFSPQRLGEENPFFPSVYFRNLLYLDSVTHDPPGPRIAQAYVDYAWQTPATRQQPVRRRLAGGRAAARAVGDRADLRAAVIDRRAPTSSSGAGGERREALGRSGTLRRVAEAEQPDDGGGPRRRSRRNWRSSRAAGRKEIAERIKTAREWGDLKENSEYHDAKNDQAHLETKIARLREKIADAVVVEESAGSSAGVVGLRLDGRRARRRGQGADLADRELARGGPRRGSPLG